MNIAGLTTLAIALFSFSVLFQIVTLPSRSTRAAAPSPTSSRPA